MKIKSVKMISRHVGTSGHNNTMRMQKSKDDRRKKKKKNATMQCPVLHQTEKLQLVHVNRYIIPCSLIVIYIIFYVIHCLCSCALYVRTLRVPALVNFGSYSG